MARRILESSASRLLLAVVLLPAVWGCQSPGQWAQLTRDNETLRRDKTRLERVVQQRDGSLARLHRQVENLKGLAPDRPADLFAPVRLEIASLTGGRDYDGMPGDDGVTVYLRPRDADGDIVKAPGRISIQLLDNSAVDSPRVVGVYVFDDPQTVRRMWHGRFATHHYSLKCPFPPGVALPQHRRLTVSAEFIDYLTGAVLTAVKEVSISFPDG